MNKIHNPTLQPALLLSIIPLLFLLLTIVGMLLFADADFVASWSWSALLASAGVGLLVAKVGGFLNHGIWRGFRVSASQILPAIPLLACIALIATTWMLSGVVPFLMNIGLGAISADLFLVLTCIVCATVSLLTGSSWTTIATIGVAFMGIGAGLGFSVGWTAGAVISGAYFGDKMSPLSDTTVIASSTCGVDIMRHIRYMMWTSGPAILIALAVYAIAGRIVGNGADAVAIDEIRSTLHSTFNLSPRVLIIPLVTGIMMAFRLPTLVTLGLSALAGLIGIFIFQPHLLSSIGADSVVGVVSMLIGGAEPATGVDTIDKLVSTSGLLGMLPTVILLLGSMTFAGVMIGTGMLRSITESFTKRLRHRHSLVSATVASGCLLNATTADQYLSIIISGNVYGSIYQHHRLDRHVLSRTIEDSTSVTSVLVPWNSCGITQASVLGVSTLIYAPFCIFNYLSPLMSILMAWTGWRIHHKS